MEYIKKDKSFQFKKKNQSLNINLDKNSNVLISLKETNNPVGQFLVSKDDGYIYNCINNLFCNFDLISKNVDTSSIYKKETIKIESDENNNKFYIVKDLDAYVFVFYKRDKKIKRVLINSDTSKITPFNSLIIDFYNQLAKNPKRKKKRKVKSLQK